MFGAVFTLKLWYEWVTETFREAEHSDGHCCFGHGISEGHSMGFNVGLGKMGEEQLRRSLMFLAGMAPMVFKRWTSCVCC